jgi:hypothetical protein
MGNTGHGETFLSWLSRVGSIVFVPASRSGRDS